MNDYMHQRQWLKPKLHKESKEQPKTNKASVGVQQTQQSDTLCVYSIRLGRGRLRWW